MRKRVESLLFNPRTNHNLQKLTSLDHLMLAQAWLCSAKAQMSWPIWVIVQVPCMFCVLSSPWVEIMVVVGSFGLLAHWITSSSFYSKSFDLDPRSRVWGRMTHLDWFKKIQFYLSYFDKNGLKYIPKPILNGCQIL